MSSWNFNTIVEFNASEGAFFKRNEFKSAVRLSKEEEVMKTRGIFGEGIEIKALSGKWEHQRSNKNHKVSQIVAATIFLYFRIIYWIWKCRLVSENDKEVKETRCDPYSSQVLHNLLSA